MKWIAAASLVIAVAAGAVAFARHQAASTAAAEVASLKAEAQKAQADLKVARAERDALRKEAAELELQARQLRSAADVAGRFLEAEKAVSARLREDLAMASARLAAAGSRQTRPSDALAPRLVPLQRSAPFTVRVAPGGSPAAVGAAAPAR